MSFNKNNPNAMGKIMGYLKQLSTEMVINNQQGQEYFNMDIGGGDGDGDSWTPNQPEGLFPDLTFLDNLVLDVIPTDDKDYVEHEDDFPGISGINPVGQFPVTFHGPPEHQPIAGDCGFVVTGVNPSSRGCFYSVELERLYATLGADFAIDCAWNGACYMFTEPPQGNWFIRATPVFIAPTEIGNPVRRCMQHQDSQASGGHCVLQCSGGTATAEAVYTGAGSRGWPAVLQPVTPRAGRVTLVYRFACYNSCATGIKRRETAIDLTLEDSHGNIYGRQRVKVRACARPKRDMKTDEEQAAAPSVPALARRRRSRKLRLLKVFVPDDAARRACLRACFKTLKRLARNANQGTITKYRRCIQFLNCHRPTNY